MMMISYALLGLLMQVSIFKFFIGRLDSSACMMGEKESCLQQMLHCPRTSKSIVYGTNGEGTLSL